MKFQLERKHFKDGYTIGDFFVDRENGAGWEYLFNMLEDTNRDFNKDGDHNDEGEGKIYGKTCIPFGTYKMVITMSKRFKRELPLLLNVPNYTGVRIHPGNTADDTEGCLLPGINDEKGKVHQSTECFNKLFSMMHYSGQSEWSIEII